MVKALESASQIPPKKIKHKRFSNGLNGSVKSITIADILRYIQDAETQKSMKDCDIINDSQYRFRINTIVTSALILVE